MISKSLILGLMLLPFSVFSVNDSEDNKLSEKLDLIEEIIVDAEFETSSCQMHTDWHFPAQLYGYLNLAKKYADNLQKNRNLKIFKKNLQGMMSLVEECINGKAGYWSGNWNEVWVDPIPSVPDCALATFEKMKAELEPQITALL